MTVSELLKETGWTALTDIPDTAISSGYVCDLLSWAMAHVQEGTVWITVQAHLNVVAVAQLTGCACVVVPEGISVSEETLTACKNKGVCMISAPCTAYGAVLELNKLGIGQVPS